MYLNQTCATKSALLLRIEVQHLMYLNFYLPSFTLLMMSIEVQHLMYLNFKNVSQETTSND